MNVPFLSVGIDTTTEGRKPYTRYYGKPFTVFTMYILKICTLNITHEAIRIHLIIIRVLVEGLEKRLSGKHGH